MPKKTAKPKKKAAPKKAVGSGYTADQITVLEGLDPVKKATRNVHR